MSQGVKIMKLKNDAKITSVALTEKDEEEPKEENAQPQEQDDQE